MDLAAEKLTDSMLGMGTDLGGTGHVYQDFIEALLHQPVR